MSRSHLIPFLTISLLLLTVAAAADETSTSGLQGLAGSSASLGGLPLTFVENAGQWDTPARFVAHRGDLVARFEPDAMILQVESRDADKKTRGVSVRLAFEGALATATIEGEGQESGMHNFFRGNDPAKWRSRVPGYRQILYRDLYPGIDVRVREESRELEYDVLLAPGADLEQLVIRCEGSEGLVIEPDGTLVIETALGPIRQEPPTTWHELASGERVPVECRYCLVDDTRFGFEVVDRDPSLALVIDPHLEWSTFLGGSANDHVWDVAFDSSSGDVFAAGQTISFNFPTTPGSYNPGPLVGQDAFVTRIAADGSSLVWSTLIGAEGADLAHAVASETSGAVTIAGMTYSPSFPTTVGAYDTSYNGLADAFVTRLSADGDSLIYSTFVGAILNDWAADLDLEESSGDVVFAGYTESGLFPTTPDAFDTSLDGTRDAFVCRMNADGSDLTFSTFLGGSGNEGWALGSLVEPFMMATRLTPSGAVTVTGATFSVDFPTTPEAYDETYDGDGDAFVTQLNPAGSALEYSTLLGGGGTDSGLTVTADAMGNPTVGGFTWSTDFPTTPGAFDRTHGGAPNYNDAFVTQFDATGSSLLYSTFLGGTQRDAIGEVAFTGSGDLVATGFCGPGFPAVVGSWDWTFNGSTDAFIVRLNLGGQGPLDLLYSTFVGGVNAEVGFTLALRGEEVTVGGYAQSGFPTTSGCYQPDHGGSYDGFVARFSSLVTTGVEESPPVAALEPRVRLGAPLPNPAHGRVFYDVDLSHETRVRVSVFDIQGRLVRSLVDEELPAGSHHLAWDPGTGLAAGAYYLRLTADGARETRKIFLVR